METPIARIARWIDRKQHQCAHCAAERRVTGSSFCSLSCADAAAIDQAYSM